MKIAIPVFHSRVSPRFDCAQEMILVTVKDGKIAKQQKIEFEDDLSMDRISKLLSLRVDVLICGGIDRWSMQKLQHSNLEVYAWLTGDVQDLIASFLNGDLQMQDSFRPGRRHRGPQRFRKGRHNN